VDDRLHALHDLAAAQRLERLPEVRDVGGQQRRVAVPGGEGLRGRDEVDVDHVVAVLDEVAHDGATGLPASACDDDPHDRIIDDQTQG
jgi:hypothetical protein